MFLILAALVAMAFPVRAQERELLSYDVRFAGLTVGQALFSLEQSEWSYRSRLDVVSSGIVTFFADFRAEVEGRGAYDVQGSGQPIPMSFQREWSIAELAATMTITHDPSSGVAKTTDAYINPVTGESIDPADEYDWAQDRIDVPAGLRVGVFDPISAFVYARHMITEFMETDFTVPLFDGRRRYDMEVVLGEATPLQFAGETVGSQIVTISFSPVFGFDEERGERLRETQTTLYFSNDGRFLPYRAEVSTGRGSAIMELTGDCRQNAPACQELLAKLEEVAS